MEALQAVGSRKPRIFKMERLFKPVVPTLPEYSSDLGGYLKAYDPTI